MQRHDAHAVRKGVILSASHSTFTGSDGLICVERETRYRRIETYGLPRRRLIGATIGRAAVSCVFDDLQIVLCRQTRDGRHIANLTAVMDRQDGCNFLSLFDGSFDF